MEELSRKVWSIELDLNLNLDLDPKLSDTKRILSNWSRRLEVTAKEEDTKKRILRATMERAISTTYIRPTLTSLLPLYLLTSTEDNSNRPLLRFHQFLLLSDTNDNRSLSINSLIRTVLCDLNLPSRLL